MKIFYKILVLSTFLFSLMYSRDLKMGEKAVAPWKGRDWFTYVNRVAKQGFFNPATDKIIVENKGIKNDAATYAAYEKMYNAYSAVESEKEIDPVFLQNIIKAIDVPPVSATYPALPFPPPSFTRGGPAVVPSAAPPIIITVPTPVPTTGTGVIYPGAAPTPVPAPISTITPTPSTAVIMTPTPASSMAGAPSGVPGAPAGGVPTPSGVIPAAPPAPSMIPVAPPAPSVPSAPSEPSAPLITPASSFASGSIIGSRPAPAPLPAVVAISAAEREKLIAEERKKLQADPAITQEVKRRSDMAVLDAFGDIAGEVGVSSDLKKGDLKKYVTFIAEQLRKLYANPDFKFKNALAYNFFPNGDVRAKDFSGAPFGAIVETLTLSSDAAEAEKKLQDLHNNIASREAIRRKLTDLIATCIFNVQIRTIDGIAENTMQILPTIVELMWFNIVVSQRSAEGEQFDGVVQGLLEKLKDLSSSRDPALLENFTHHLNLLRLDPDFKKFFGLLGSEAIKKATTGSVIPGQIRLLPLLESLRTDRYPAVGEAGVNQIFTTVNFPKMVRGELFSDPVENYDNAPELHVNIEDEYFKGRKHFLSQLLESSFDITTLVKKISAAKNIGEVEKTIEALKRMLPTREKEVQQVLEFIKQARGDVQKIPTQYKTQIQQALNNIFSGALPAEKTVYEIAINNVLKMLDGLYQTEAIPIELKKMLKQAYSSANAWIALKSALEVSTAIPADKKQIIMKVLLSPYATQADLFDALSKSVKGKEFLENIFSEIFNQLFPRVDQQNVKLDQINSHRNLLEFSSPPYGLIMTALRDASEEIDRTEQPSGKLQRLVRELRAILEGRIDATAKVHKAFKSSITVPGKANVPVESIGIGLYKNNPDLAAAINNVEKYDIETALVYIKALVDNAQPDVRGLDEQLLIIKDKLFALMSQALRTQLDEANAGKEIFSELPLKLPNGRLIRENSEFYKGLKGKFKPLADALSSPEALAKVTDAELDKIIEEIVEQAPAIPATGKKLVREYLTNIKEKILNLQKTAKIIAEKQSALRAAQEEEKKKKAAEAAAAARPGSPAPAEEPEIGAGGVPVAPPPPTM